MNHTQANTDNRQEKSGINSVVAGVAGVGIGMVAASLMNKDTRKSVGDAVNKAVDGVKKGVAELQHRAEDAVSDQPELRAAAKDAEQMIKEK